MEVSMRATVALDDELLRKAQEFSGVTERTALLRAALKSLIHVEASRRLAAVGGTEPNLEDIKRVRAGYLFCLVYVNCVFLMLYLSLV
jgi:Arc/MetJ family transcription regulator